MIRDFKVRRWNLRGRLASSRGLARTEPLSVPSSSVPPGLHLSLNPQPRGDLSTLTAGEQVVSAQLSDSPGQAGPAALESRLGSATSQGPWLTLPALNWRLGLVLYGLALSWCPCPPFCS